MEVAYTIETFNQAFGAGTPDDTAAALSTAVSSAANDGTPPAPSSAGGVSAGGGSGGPGPKQARVTGAATRESLRHMRQDIDMSSRLQPSAAISAGRRGGGGLISDELSEIGSSSPEQSKLVRRKSARSPGQGLPSP